MLVNDDIVFTASALSTYVAGPTKGKAAKSVATESEATEAAASSENDGEELR